MRRALPFLILLLAGLCACKAEDPRAPFTESRIPPGLSHQFYPPQGWAWGLIKVGKAPPVRYGVAAPPVTPRGQIIILPGYGETAEGWFWTARDLMARGYVVWVLEGSGQGGSGRRSLPRDMVDAASLDADVAAVAAFSEHLVRTRPRYLIAVGSSAAVAARAAELGVQLDGLLLFEPQLRSSAESRRRMSGRYLSTIGWMRRLGLGRLRPVGAEGWRGDDPLLDTPNPLGEPALRRWVSRQWQKANPDLRMGDASVDWLFAKDAETDAALLGWPRVTTRTLVVGDNICGSRPDCIWQPSERPAPPPGAHADFIGQVLRFIDPTRAALAPAPAAVTVEPES